VKAPETTDEIPRAKDTLSQDAPKYESTKHEPQSPSGTKSSPNTLEAPPRHKATPGIAFPCSSPNNELDSSEPAESANTTPPSPWCHGLGPAGEALVGGDSARPQPKSIPRRTPLVAETLANDPDFIKVGFHIGRFITAVVDIKSNRVNTMALRTELNSTWTRINMSTSCIKVHYCLCSMLTSPFRSEIN
jgi:hypothetical protein